MKILVGYDGSNAAKEALSQAAKHAVAFGAEVIVMVSLSGGTVTYDVEVARAKEDLKFTMEVFQKAGILCETKLMVRGNEPGQDLVDFAKEREIDMIVIGVRRRSRVGKLLFGSNAHYVVVEAHCSVLCVK